jgi:ech hydrogenase subunit E
MNMEMADKILNNLTILNQKVEEIYEQFLNNWSISLKYKGIGTLTFEDAMRFGALGPLARASGVKIDSRWDFDVLPYGDFDIKMIVENGGDVHSRNMVRLKETFESIRLCKDIIKNLPEGDTNISFKGNPIGDSYIKMEAPRGEIYYFVRGVKKPILDRVKIKTPTLAQIPAFIHMFKNSEFCDVPAILASLDPCMSCTAR